MALSKYISSFGVGLFVGASLTLAPMPGKKMQRKVANIDDEALDKVESFKDAGAAPRARPAGTAGGVGCPKAPSEVRPKAPAAQTALTGEDTE